LKDACEGDDSGACYSDVTSSDFIVTARHVQHEQAWVPCWIEVLFASRFGELWATTCTYYLDRSNAADRPASLRCNALFWGGLRPLRCCVGPQRGLHHFSLSHSHSLCSNTVGGKRKRGGSRSKLD